ncbi:hypothetical protein LT493_25115 [Streptomyces tricolor]|nr:hypothetical protein [Streptomyces tricolor]
MIQTLLAGVDDITTWLAVIPPRRLRLCTPRARVHRGEAPPSWRSP